MLAIFCFVGYEFSFIFACGVCILLKCLAVFFSHLTKTCSCKPVWMQLFFFFHWNEVTSTYSAFYWFVSLGNEWRCGFYARFSAMFACFWQCELWNWFLFYICINIYLCIIVNIFWILFVSNISVWEGIKELLMYKMFYQTFSLMEL